MREVERVVRDHEVSLARAVARRLGEAGRDERTAPAGAAVASDGELGPERFRRLELQLGAIARLGLVEPALHRLPGARVSPLGHQERLEALQLPAADVVLASLEHGDRQLTAEGAGGDRHVLVEELFLERLRRGRDDDALARFERRQQVGEALPDAGARLSDEMLAGRERVLDGTRERSLLRPWLVLGQGALERAAGAEDLLHLRPQRTRSNGCSPRARSGRSPSGRSTTPAAGSSGGR